MEILEVDVVHFTEDEDAAVLSGVDIVKIEVSSFSFFLEFFFQVDFLPFKNIDSII